MPMYDSNSLLVYAKQYLFIKFCLDMLDETLQDITVFLFLLAQSNLYLQFE